MRRRPYARPPAAATGASVGVSHCTRRAQTPLLETSAGMPSVDVISSYLGCSHGRGPSSSVAGAGVDGGDGAGNGCSSGTFGGGEVPMLMHAKVPSRTAQIMA